MPGGLGVIPPVTTGGWPGGSEPISRSGKPWMGEGIHGPAFTPGPTVGVIIHCDWCELELLPTGVPYTALYSYSSPPGRAGQV